MRTPKVSNDASQLSSRSRPQKTDIEADRDTVNGAVESPVKSRKRVKTEAEPTEDASLAHEGEGIPKKAKISTNIKQEHEVEEEEEEEEEERTGKQASETPKRTSRKRKIQEVSKETQLNGDTPKLTIKKVEEAIKKEAASGNTSSRNTKRKTAAKIKEEEVGPSELPPSNFKRKSKVENQENHEGAEDDVEPDEEGTKKTKRHRKTKEEKEAEAMPLAARTVGLRMHLGAHVSGAGGVQNSISNSLHIGANALALFLKSQRKWANPPLQDTHREQFLSLCKEHSYDAYKHVLPHGSYLVNLAQPDAEKAAQAYDTFLDDLHRCEALGIKLYNFHPGSTGPHPRSAAIGRIASALNRAHGSTKTVTPLLETMAGGGNVIGSTFQDLRDIIALVDDKERIGVCLDTCHVFAAGYDLRTPEAFEKTMEEFDKIVGMKYMRALHLNDSKAVFDSHRDLHQNIGLGFLGLRAFHNVMNEKRFEGLPLVLETPIDSKDADGKEVEDKGVWAREIKMLESLIDTDAESEEFRELEKDLADKGAEERAKYREQFEKKVEKDKKKAQKGQTKLKFGKGKEKEGEEEKEGGSDSEGR